VRVIVVGDIPHVVIDVVREFEVLGHDGCKAFMHVFEMLGRRAHAVPAPNDHRHRADFAFRDPTDVVFVEPRRDSSRLTEVAAVNAFEVQLDLPS